MKQNDTDTSLALTSLNILLADDDADDRLFFDKALKKIEVLTRLVSVMDGEKLMSYLSENYLNLPDVLFLDLNMPCKNGYECMSEIKQNEKLKQLPVIIYSTHLHEKDARLLYQQGAHYYIRKTDMIELSKILYRILNRLVANSFARPELDKFIFSMERASL